MGIVNLAGPGNRLFTSGGGGAFTPDFLYRFVGTNGTEIASSATAIPGYSGATIQSRYVAGNDTGGKFDSSQTYGGRATSGKFRIVQGSDGFGDGSTYGDMGFFINLPTAIRATEGDTLHCRIRLRIPSGFSFDTGGGNIKWLRWNPHISIDPNSTTRGCLDHWILSGDPFNGTHQNAQNGWMYGSEVNGGDPNEQFSSNKILPSDTWATFESQMKFTTTAANSVRRTWGPNGEFACEKVGANRKWKDASGVQQTSTTTAYNTFNSTTDYMTTILFITYWNGGSGLNGGSYPIQNQHLWVDEVVIHKNLVTLPQVDEYGNAYIGDEEIA